MTVYDALVPDRVETSESTGTVHAEGDLPELFDSMKNRARKPSAKARASSTATAGSTSPASVRIGG
jgi:hypothetical protein